MKNLKKKYDLVVIGGGPAGTPVAIEYAKLSPHKKVALIDISGKLGGECLFQGCIPSKILEATAHSIKSLKELQNFGISLDLSHYELLWERVKQKKDEILDKRSDAAANVVSELENIDLIKAEASFTSQNTIALHFEDTVKEISFDKAVIGTGSHSFIPNYKGNTRDKIWTNSDFFAKMELPKSLAIIGTGAIAIEFAQILSQLGVKIYLFGRHENILNNIDIEASDYLKKSLQNNENIELILNATIEEVNFTSDSFTLSYIQGTQLKTLNVHRVLSAAGRTPNIAGLNLEKAGVEFNKKGIKISKHLQTTNKHIFANGDVAEGFPKFAHTAQYGAHTLAQNLFLEHNLFSIDYSKNSWVLFTTPNVMMAGVGEEEASKKGITVIVDKFFFVNEAKSQIQQEDYGYLKFIVNAKDNTIIGISALHEEAHTMGGEASLIVANKLTLKNIIDSIHPHPTSSEAFVMLAKQMMGVIMLETLKKPLVKTLLSIERWL